MADLAGIYAGRVVSYEGSVGYSRLRGLNALFQFSTVEAGADPDALGDSALLAFGDQDIGPGESFGSFTDDGTSKSFDVRLPWEALPTFWRGIRDFSGPDHDSSFRVSWDTEGSIRSFFLAVSENLEGDVDKDRRERNDAMRRKVLDSWQ